MKPVVENACFYTGTYRVVEAVTDDYDICQVCFPDADGLEDVDDAWELCKPANKTKVHKTERDAGIIKQHQEDYSGYTQPCDILSKMTVEEFDERVGGGV